MRVDAPAVLAVAAAPLDPIWLLRVAVLVVSILVARRVLRDANGLKKRGARLAPPLWAILVFFAWVIALPVYLVLRFTVWKNQVEAVRVAERVRAPDCPHPPEDAE
ncbi:MAG TPA: hypothetical protein VG013_26935 [Gemmataceae bacterium]|jgi:hypothetical protein|nr:hypothetical protein [Gemmataceae bacterium]